MDCVVQFDPPVDPKQFSHRCGRTARAGRDGRAWLLLSETEIDYAGTPYFRKALSSSFHLSHSFCQDFMSIRKIPLKERKKLSGEDGSKELDQDSEDPEVETLLEKMRAVVRRDRDFHDKVSLL